MKIRSFIFLFFTVFISAWHLRAENFSFIYEEPGIDTDGAILTDLEKTRVYAIWNLNIYKKDIPATSPAGNQKIQDTIWLPEKADEERIYELWATAFDTSGNESERSNNLFYKVDRLAPSGVQ